MSKTGLLFSINCVNKPPIKLNIGLQFSVKVEGWMLRTTNKPSDLDSLDILCYIPLEAEVVISNDVHLFGSIR